MVGRGRKFKFHGAFKSKRKAMAKERAGSNRFIREAKIKGHRRYIVMSRKGA